MKADAWCAHVRDEFDRGYRLGRHDALFYGDKRPHEGDEDTLEGYSAGYTAMSQWLAYNKAWRELNERDGSQAMTTLNAFGCYRQAARTIEEMDELCGLNGPRKVAA